MYFELLMDFILKPGHQIERYLDKITFALTPSVVP